MTYDQWWLVVQGVTVVVIAYRFVTRTIFEGWTIRRVADGVKSI